MATNAKSFATGLLIGSLALCVTSCETPPPGKGPKAETGYRAAAPVIAALEKSHEKRGHYPADLHELVPEYLPDANDLIYRDGTQSLNSPGRAASSPQDEFGYRQKGDGYTLMFWYSEPGVNYCQYDSKTRSWVAGGYY